MKQAFQLLKDALNMTAAKTTATDKELIAAAEHAIETLTEPRPKEQITMPANTITVWIDGSCFRKQRKQRVPGAGL